MGDWAYCCELSYCDDHAVNGDPPMRHAGNVLSILRKNPDGNWVLFRDANLLQATKATCELVCLPAFVMLFHSRIHSAKSRFKFSLECTTPSMLE